MATIVGDERPRALKLIIGFKVARAALSLIGAVIAVLLVVTGLAQPLQRALELMRDHAVTGLALSVSQLLVLASRADHLELLATVLALDSVLLGVEGWALLRGRWWGPWLVVGVSSLLVPFEVGALVSKPSLIRVGVMVVNLAVVGWLVTHAVRSHSLARVRRLGHRE